LNRALRGGYTHDQSRARFTYSRNDLIVYTQVNDDDCDEADAGSRL